MSEIRQNLKYLGVALLAGAAGAALGILFAPASGRETRRMLSRRMRETKEDLVRKSGRVLEEVAGRLEHGIEEGKKKLAHVAGV